MSDMGEGAAGVIVVGVDGSDSSKDALRWAARQAQLTGAELKVVSTWYTPTMIYGPGVLPFPTDFDPEGDSRSGLGDTIRETLGDDSKVKVSTVVVEGHPAPELLRASEGADLLVLGSRGHGAFAGMLLGSVSEHCLAHASCPVVVVRHSTTPA